MQSADVTLTLPSSMAMGVPEYYDPDAVVREEVLSWRARGEEGVVSFLSLIVGDREQCRAAMEEIDAIERVDVATIDERRFYVYVEMDYREADRAVFGAFDAYGVVIVPPIVYLDAETIQLTMLGDPGELRSVLAAFPETVSVDVGRVSEHSALPGSLAGRLTSRQLEALTVATEVGYFAVPRTGSLADVAGELGCSKSAASTLLRRAQSHLVDAALGR